MEFVGQPRLSGACDLLGVPGLSSMDVDDDEGEVVIGIRPKSSPLPRRKSSVTDEDSDPEPPLSGSRRVSFADAKGLSLVQVKEFDAWDVPVLPGYESSEGEGKEAEEYFLSPHTFSLPLTTEELCVKVRDQKIELETIDLLPGTTILKGVIRVLNVSFSKAVYIRTTLDAWSTHFDLLAEYIPGSSDGLMDCFSFKLTLVPPFGEWGARVDFCLRYETPVGTFWANNNNKNYVLFCCKRAKDKPQRDNVNKKSCLKTVSHNFSPMENISAVEASPQDNISAVVSKHGEGVNNMKAIQIFDGQSGTSGEEGQKLQTENRRNSSRRSGRKAARMARVRDHFAQRDRGVNGTERDETVPEAKQEAQEEKPKETLSFPERNSKSERSQFVSESQETCSESLLEALHAKSPTHYSTSVSEPEKSESIFSNLADLAGGESAPDIPDNSLHSGDEPAAAECCKINKSVSDAEEKSQKRSTSDECTNSTADEPVGSVVSAVISETLVSQTPSFFTFGTVVAPLYHQMFGREGSESQTVGDRGNPAWVTLSTGDLTHHCPHAETKECRCPALTDVNNVQGNVIKMQESNQDATPDSPPTEEEETGLSLVGDALNQTDTLQDPCEIIQSDRSCTNTSENPDTLSGATAVHPLAVDILHSNLLSAQMQEDNLTCDHQNQTTAETAQAQLPEDTDSQSEGQEVMAGLEASCLHGGDETNQLSNGGEENDTEDDSGETITTTVAITTTTASSEAEKLLEPLHDLDPNEINHSATKETADSYISICEKDFSTPDTSLENQGETNNVEEQTKLTNNSYEDEIEGSGKAAGSLPKEVISNYPTHRDMFVELKDEDEDEQIIVSEEIEHLEVEAAAEDFSSADNTEVKNWEMMVEEEEENMLTDQEGGETIHLKVVETDQGGQLEDAGIETTFVITEEEEEEEEEKTPQEAVEELTDAGENGTKEGVGGEEILETVAGKDEEEELENIQATVTAAEDDIAEEVEVEKREEKDKMEIEKHFPEMHEVNIKMTNVQEEEEIDGDEEMETNLNRGNEACGVWEDQEKPTEENGEEENPNYKEEVVVDEAGDSANVDADSEGVTREDGEDEEGCFDISQSKAEDGLSAPVSVQDKSVAHKERKGGSTHILIEMRLYKEEDLQSSMNVAHDRSKPENESCTAEGDTSGILTDEPESDQTSHDSASAESDSDDDEVELYMNCLRAVHAGAQATKDRNKDPGFSVGKRPSVNRSKLLSTPMPSISESLDEEQHLSCLHEDVDMADIQPTAAALPLSSGQESISRNVSWWRETFSCSNISKTLLYTTLLVVFLVVAYHYDFLACFGLYLISVLWLCCQGETPPVKNNNRIG